MKLDYNENFSLKHAKFVVAGSSTVPLREDGKTGKVSKHITPAMFPPRPKTADTPVI